MPQGQKIKSLVEEREFLKPFESLNATLKDNNEQILKFYEALNKKSVPKNIKEFRQSREELNNLEKESIRIKKQIAREEAKIAKFASDSSQRSRELKDKRKLLQTEEQLSNVRGETNKQLQRTRSERNRANREIRKSATEYGKLEVALERAEREYRELAATQGLSTKETKRAQREVQELRSQLDSIDEPIKRNRRNVGNYTSAFGKLGGAINRVAGIAGLAFGAFEAFSFSKEARQLALDAKGVEFAFNRISGASKVLQRAITATRGSISELEIQKSINEFNNFGLEIEKLPQLLEFVTVTAAQTGKSFDYLFDSLTEGISKQSARRIDNLGISTSELNKELEKTPNFLTAVANIAERRISAAGDVLDQGANAQQRFNAALDDAKLAFGRLVSTGVEPFIGGLTNLLQKTAEYLDITKEESELLQQQQIEFNGLINSVKDMNQEDVVRQKNIEILNGKYGDQIGQVVDLNTSLNDLNNIQGEVNDKFVKQITILAAQEKFIDVQQRLFENRTEQAKATREASAAQEEMNTLIKNGEDVEASFRDGVQQSSREMLKYRFEKQKSERQSQKLIEKEKELKQEFEDASKAASDLGIDLSDLFNSESSGSGFTKTEKSLKEAKKTIIETVNALLQQRAAIRKNIDTLEFLLSQTKDPKLVKEINSELGVLRNELDETIKNLGRFGFEFTQAFSLSGGDAKKLIRVFEDSLPEDLSEKTIEVIKESADKASKELPKVSKQIADSFSEALGNAFSGNLNIGELLSNSLDEFGTDISDTLIDNQLTKFREASEERLKIIDEEEEQIAKLRENGVINEEQYILRRTQLENRRREEERQARVQEAKAEKKKALFDIAINTAAAITKTAANLGFPAAIPFIAAIAAQGAIQSAIVSARKIPKFFKGVKNKKDDGPGIVSDRGIEAVQYPGEEPFLAPENSTMWLPKGTNVFTHEETKQMYSGDGRTVEEIRGLRKDFRRKNTNVVVNIHGETKNDKFWFK